MSDNPFMWCPRCKRVYPVWRAHVCSCNQGHDGRPSRRPVTKTKKELEEEKAKAAREKAAKEAAERQLPLPGVEGKPMCWWRLP